MQVNLYVYDGQGKLQPIETECDWPVIPRVGETVSIGNRRAHAKVIEVEYLLPADSPDMLVAVILDHHPGEQAG